MLFPKNKHSLFFYKLLITNKIKLRNKIYAKKNELKGIDAFILMEVHTMKL